MMNMPSDEWWEKQIKKDDTVVIKKAIESPYKRMKGISKEIVDFIDGLCICDLQTLMVKGCQCRGH